MFISTIVVPMKKDPTSCHVLIFKNPYLCIKFLWHNISDKVCHYGWQYITKHAQVPPLHKLHHFPVHNLHQLSLLLLLHYRCCINDQQQRELKTKKKATCVLPHEFLTFQYSWSPSVPYPTANTPCNGSTWTC